MAEMTFTDLEQAYERLAEAIDTAGPRIEALFLTKLVLLQAQRAGDLTGFLSAMETALRDLPEG